MKWWKQYQHIFEQERAIKTAIRNFTDESVEIIFVRPWDEWPVEHQDSLIAVHDREDNISAPEGVSQFLATLNIKLYAPSTLAHVFYSTSDLRMKDLCLLARRVVRGEESLEEKIQEKKNQQCVDVALYLNGKVRGSIVSQHTDVEQAIKKAASLVTKDLRFKPLTAEETSRATLELSVSTGFWLPLTKRDMHASRPYPHYMYKVEVDRMERGWYMPSVVTQSGRKSMREFVMSLLKDKAELSEDESRRAVVSISPAKDFYESKHDVQARQLSIDKLFDHIVCQIDNVGCVEAVLPTTDDLSYRLDIPRIAFTIRTLSECVQRGFRVAEATSVIEKMNAYLIGLQESMSETEKLYVAFYTDSNTEEVNMYLTKYLESPLIEIHDNCLTLLQAMCSLKRNPEYESKFRVIVEPLLKRVYGAWSEHKMQASLAGYADLAPLLFTHDLQTEAAEVVSWYRQLQSSDGSFPNTPTDTYTYTRGTSKVLESLALLENTDDLVSKGFSWLSLMQCTENNQYMVSTQLRGRREHGFWHDYWDKSVWLDASCHALISLVRLK